MKKLNLINISACLIIFNISCCLYQEKKEYSSVVEYKSDFEFSIHEDYLYADRDQIRGPFFNSVQNGKLIIESSKESGYIDRTPEFDVVDLKSGNFLIKKAVYPFYDGGLLLPAFSDSSLYVYQAPLGRVHRIKGNKMVWEELVNDKKMPIARSGKFFVKDNLMLFSHNMKGIYLRSLDGSKTIHKGTNNNLGFQEHLANVLAMPLNEIGVSSTEYPGENFFLLRFNNDLEVLWEASIEEGISHKISSISASPYYYSTYMILSGDKLISYKNNYFEVRNAETGVREAFQVFENEVGCRLLSFKNKVFWVSYTFEDKFFNLYEVRGFKRLEMNKLQRFNLTETPNPAIFLVGDVLYVYQDENKFIRFSYSDNQFHPIDTLSVDGLSYKFLTDFFTGKDYLIWER